MNESTQPRMDQMNPESFATQSVRVAEHIASGLESGGEDVNGSRVDMALRNIVVLGDRVRENLDLTGPMSEDEKARLDTLEGKALAILVLADRDPADSISGLGGVQGLVYTKQCDPALTPFVAHIVREGNALVADVQSRGGVVKPLESYFVNNMTGLGKSL